MRIRGQSPKLGALCRWVRDLDVISGLAERIDGTGAKLSIREKELVLVLDAILRTTGPVDYTTADDVATLDEPIILKTKWDLKGQGEVNTMVYASVLDRSIFSSSATNIQSKFRIIETVGGLQRKPPNLHPAILHASQDNAIQLSSIPPNPTHHKHPIVPNLHLLKDVLSPEECTQIIAAAEMIGFTPDAPIRAEGEEISVLAHNFYWIVDNCFSKVLWDRVKPFIPECVRGKTVRGLNRRFRVYRYVPGAEYRAHIGKCLISI